MLRRTMMALAAVALLGAGMVTSTEASARGHGGGGHGGGRGGGHGFHGGGHRGGGGFHRGGGFRGFHGGGFHRGGYRPRHFYAGPRYSYGGISGCYVRRLVLTPWGPRHRLVNRCY